MNPSKSRLLETTGQIVSLRVVFLAACGLLVPLGLSASHASILKPEFVGWSRDGSTCVLFKRIEASESTEFEELLLVSLGKGGLMVERFGLHEEQERPDYMEEYEGRTLSDRAAKDRIRGLEVRKGTALGSRVEATRTVIPFPAVEIQIVYVVESVETSALSYTALYRVWSDDKMLLKSSRSGESEFDLPSEKVVVASLSPNRRYLLVITQIESYDSWFQFFIVDLVDKVILGRKMVVP
ncbi:MAG TPA: hypothetical protein VLQ45_22160 [Thermoanaerobaculia bacterium]|nr:hypothetical protein [Thermoanaerobaculia bacterium]